MEAQRQLDDTVSYRREMGVRVPHLLQIIILIGLARLYIINSGYLCLLVREDQVIQFILIYSNLTSIRATCSGEQAATSQVGAVGQLVGLMSQRSSVRVRHLQRNSLLISILIIVFLQVKRLAILHLVCEDGVQLRGDSSTTERRHEARVQTFDSSLSDDQCNSIVFL